MKDVIVYGLSREIIYLIKLNELIYIYPNDINNLKLLPVMFVSISNYVKALDDFYSPHYRGLYNNATILWIKLNDKKEYNLSGRSRQVKKIGKNKVVEVFYKYYNLHRMTDKNYDGVSYDRWILRNIIKKIDNYVLKYVLLNNEILRGKVEDIYKFKDYIQDIIDDEY